jgi:hypothetical protein
MLEQDDHLQDFSYREIKSGQVLLYWKGRHIKTLSRIEAGRFLDKINQADSREALLLMAKVTGNFKRGNERSSLSNG